MCISLEGMIQSQTYLGLLPLGQVICFFETFTTVQFDKVGPNIRALICPMYGDGQKSHTESFLQFANHLEGASNALKKFATYWNDDFKKYVLLLCNRKVFQTELETRLPDSYSQA